MGAKGRAWYNSAREDISGLDAIERARKAVEAASDKQASDIVLLDLRGLCSFADYFVLCSGESERQLVAIREGVEASLDKEGAPCATGRGMRPRGGCSWTMGISSSTSSPPSSGDSTSWMKSGPRPSPWCASSERYLGIYLCQLDYRICH